MALQIKSKYERIRIKRLDPILKHNTHMFLKVVTIKLA